MVPTPHTPTRRHPPSAQGTVGKTRGELFGDWMSLSSEEKVKQDEESDAREAELRAQRAQEGRGRRSRAADDRLGEGFDGKFDDDDGGFYEQFEDDE